MEFEWDPAKALKNLRTHDVSFGVATSVFSDPLSIRVSNPDHSNDEDRYIIPGMSSRLRFLMVAHTDRGDRIRIISARELTSSERMTYEARIQV